MEDSQPIIIEIHKIPKTYIRLKAPMAEFQRETIIATQPRKIAKEGNSFWNLWHSSLSLYPKMENHSHLETYLPFLHFKSDLKQTFQILKAGLCLSYKPKALKFHCC